jgi:DNA-directed RNA polymerase sigma subunit (sigma70/sigma32)
MLLKDLLSESELGQLRPRYRLVLKLRTGAFPITEEELSVISQEKRTSVIDGKSASLRKVADLLNVSHERIRQIEVRALQILDGG